jgi:acetylornithine deacetylase
MDAARQEVLRNVDEAWPQQVEHLQALVREPSTLGNEAGVQRLMQSTLREMDLEVHAFEPDIGSLAGRPGFSPPEWSYRGRQNVVGIWPGTASDGGRSLVLNGHVDVVSAEPLSQWNYDPWGAEIVGGRLYGRGACDMKSGVNAMVYAVRAIQAADIELKNDVIIQSVIEEECTGNGALACLERGFVGDGCLIPEPFPEQALVAQVGVLWCRLNVRGTAAHVMGANRAINAIEKVYLLIDAMRQLESELNSQKPAAFQAVDWPINFNPGVIRAGDWPSTVPAQCELEFRMGFYPGMSAEDAKAMVRERLLTVAARDPWLKDNPPEISFYGFHAEGTAVAFDDSPVIRAINSAHQTVTGRTLAPFASTATTDSRFFLLYYGIPATCYGARGAHMHGIDEYVELPTVRQVTKVIAAFILEWCGVAE